MARASLTGRDFRRVYRSGVKAREDGITVWVADREKDDDVGLGMAVRASIGTAVERNRLRRRIRAVFGSAGLPPGHDVVVHATREAAGRNFQELQAVILTALRRAGALS